MARTRSAGGLRRWWRGLKDSDRITVLGVVVAGVLVPVLVPVMLHVLDDNGGEEGSATTGGTEVFESPLPSDQPAAAPQGPFSGPTFDSVVDAGAVGSAQEPVGLYPAPTLNSNSVDEADDGERLTAVCQVIGDPMRDDDLRYSDVWTLVETPVGYAYISEIFFGRHELELDECPSS